MMPPPEADYPEPEPETGESEVEMLKKSLEAEKAKAEEYLAGWKRDRADFINSKRRFEQEKEETIKYANSGLILKVLPIMDDFERALGNIPAGEADWLEGIKLVERNLRNLLQSQGLTEIKAVGEKFDPSLHDAVMQAEGDEGVIVSELGKGYKLADRVIRPSKVVVGSGKAEMPKE